MSQIHQCNDGSTDVTGRATPQEYVPCGNAGGEVVVTPEQTDDGPSDDITIIEDSTPTTAGFGDNKMLIYLVAAGALLWYLNKEGYLKKILK
tara:strand:+ start:88 stop:363 length:276 start_codon:yes stop_codon:yes gene_type:complete